MAETGSSSASASSGSASTVDPTGSTGDLLCEGLENEEHGGAVELTIRNDTDAPIFLVEQYYCLSSFIAVEDPGGEPVEWRSDGWVISCEDLAGPAPSCGGPACLGETVRIDPGGEYGQSWPGYVHDPMMLDPTCAMDPDAFDSCGTTCFIEHTPVPGEYRISVEASADLDCGEQPCPECEEDHGNGACSIFIDGVAVGPDRFTAEALVAYPDITSAEIVFE
jgi:hypothetical protein